jgi:hypothetical protein
MLYLFFWVIPRHLNFICRHFGTLCLFHLHRLVGAEWLNLLYFSLQHLIWPQLCSQWLQKHIMIFYERCLLLLSIKTGMYLQILSHPPIINVSYMLTDKWSESNRHYFCNISLHKKKYSKTNEMCLCACHEVRVDYRGTALLVPSPGTRWRWMVSFTPQQF